MTWRISSAGRWKPYRWQICHLIPALEMVEEGLQCGNEWTDTHVCECLPVSEETDHQKYVWHLHSNNAVTLTVLNLSQVQISTTVTSSRYPTWSHLWWETSTSLSTCSVKFCSQINDRRTAGRCYSRSGKCTVTIRACLQLTYLSAYLWC